MCNQKSLLLGLSLALLCIPVASVQAQLLPDNSLGNENSIIKSINSLEDRIDGGAIRGKNLFHSFKEFNIGNNKSVYFNNPTNIENILTRVTGTNQSNILGKLGVLGNANLFLINPNGIIFGKDASLDINGSFVGSSASFIDFADGMRFSAVSPHSKPLLTISTPLGLGMGSNPGEIRVQGEGNRLSASRLGSPFRDNGTKALEVNPGKTIALIGGDIIFEGGSLKTNSGNIELGSVGSGKVDFTFNLQNLEFSYDRAETFQDIQLLQESSLQLNSISKISNIKNAGSIQLQGKRVSLQDGSVILTDNQSELPSKGININATESLELLTSNITEIQFSSLRSQASFGARGGDIKISTKRLTVESGGAISAYIFGSNSGGNIDIKASDFVKVIGVSKVRNFPSSIITNTFNSGNGGNVDISTNRFISLNGSNISSSTFSSGDAGNLTIDALESVEVIGIEPNSLQKSFVTSLTLNSGNGGDVIVNSQRVIVKDGGRIDASTIGSGAAGNITINATQKVELLGSVPEFLIPSQITSSANIADQSIQELFGFPPILNGESGTININTNKLNIVNGALLAVKNDGSGNAGKLTIKAKSINIDNQGSISATTTSGKGGGIDLQAQNLILRRNGKISATAGTGDGGNISINAQILAALENSDITANSQGSFGGKVEINAKGIFGTQFREFPTLESDITATSGKGAEFNGVVDINTISINPNLGLAELPTGLTDSSNKIAAGCGSNIGNNFTATGRGGLPENPNQLFSGNNPIVDLIPTVPTSKNQQYSTSSKYSINQDKTEIVEAKGWIIDSQGKIEFVAEIPEVRNHSGTVQIANCQLLSLN